jgi:sporulation protein YlmC with PRC-barrel domain
MTKSDDDAVFRRALGEPERVTAAQQPTQPDKAAGYFDSATLKVIAFADDSKEVQAGFGRWAGSLMRSCATATVRDLRNKDIVSYSLPHESKDGVYVGRVTDVDKDNARVEIQQHVLSPEGEWVPVPTRHTVDWASVQRKFSEFPEPRGDEPDEDGEYDEAKVRASFRDYFTGPSPRKRR